MSVQFLPDFIKDLQDGNGANFAKRVFLKLFDERGNFRRDVNDHRYHGIADSWIRYVSQGTSAYRVIYIRRGEDIFLYRAGVHSVEDRLSSPDIAEGTGVGRETGEFVEEKPKNTEGEADLGRFLCSLRTPYLSHLILGRRLIPHKEVVLISPFLSLSLLTRTAKLGRMFDDFIDDGSNVTLVTLPPCPADLPAFKDLEARGIELLFHDRIHAKLYMFVVNKQKLTGGRDYQDLYVLGSANLTDAGFGAERGKGNEELCYELPVEERSSLESYIAHIALGSDDLIKIKMSLAREQRRNGR
ncbi:hypothetical protein FJ981_04565 [Mesorhizobium sp. B1-1-4]|uniref:hypothetical protein n=1 Tax=Mesorhizobium sp. B1-1-4 TaxID=2589980 RepID=UPI00112A0AAB|nr:hypothetical protein [Mesorhizobium sp. B1-1-4]TPN59647.1 hypothetical protein FJ981_04565 [Mesorhizobium sp. B1-1-4]